MERQNNSQNPSGIWQGIWAELFRQMINQMTFNNYVGAWETSLIIQAQLPPDCREDVKPFYLETSKIFSKEVEGYNKMAAYQNKIKQVNKEAPQALRNLMSQIISSLYERKWINRPDFSAQPKYEKKGHL
jgi:hypothetical protein